MGTTEAVLVTEAAVAVPSMEVAVVEDMERGGGGSHGGSEGVSSSFTV